MTVNYAKIMYKAYLIDWDGCAARTLEVWLQAYREVLLTEGISLSDRQIVDDYFGTGETGTKKYGLDYSSFYGVLLPLVESRLDQVKLAPDFQETVTALKAAGNKISLVSSSNRRFIEPVLHKQGIIDLIDLIITAEDVKNIKPDPEPLEKAINLLGSDKSETVMVGDSDKDSLAASAAGIDCIIYYPELNYKFYSSESIAELKKTRLISSFRELWPS